MAKRNKGEDDDKKYEERNTKEKGNRLMDALPMNFARWKRKLELLNEQMAVRCSRIGKNYCFRRSVWTTRITSKILTES